MGETTLANKRRYAAYHNYTLIVESDEGDWQYRKHRSWGRLTTLLKHLHKFDLLVWMDSDVVVTDMAVKIEDRLSEMPSSASIAFTQHAMLSTGVILARRGLPSYEILTEALVQKEYFDTWPYEVGALFKMFGNPTYRPSLAILPPEKISRPCRTSSSSSVSSGDDDDGDDGDSPEELCPWKAGVDFAMQLEYGQVAEPLKDCCFRPLLKDQMGDSEHERQANAIANQKRCGGEAHECCPSWEVLDMALAAADASAVPSRMPPAVQDRV